MKRQITYVTLPVCAAIVLAGAWWASAGPPDLNPPPGPVGVSGRFGTRAAISSLPFTINQCGSYFLTDCLTGVAGQNGITINADDVTLDLNGFALIGVAGSLDGVAVPALRMNLAVLNGTVSGWGQSGIDASLAFNSQLTDLRALGNGLDGLRAGNACTVTNCTARDNTSIGIFASLGSTVTNCTASDNTFRGIAVGNSSTVTNCTATSNGDDGINASIGSTVTNCSAQLNADDGIFTRDGGTVTNCSAQSNGGDGIATNRSCTVTNCTATSNTGDGISVSFDSRVVGNNCDSNGFAAGDGAGIHVVGIGQDNRIEGNNVTDNDRGIDVDGSGNIIIKNTASGNATNYDIVAGNSVGSILNVAGATITTTNPWRNFEY